MIDHSKRRVLRAHAMQVSLLAAVALGAVAPLACRKDDSGSSSGGATPTPTTPVPPGPMTTATPPPAGLLGTGSPTDQDINQFAHPEGDKAVGQDVFRFETFGNEGFWTRVLQLPQGMKEAGVTPLQALALGLSVDIDAVPAPMKAVLAAELKTDLSPANAPALNSPSTTEALVEANAVIGVSARNVKMPLNGTLDIDATDVYAGESVGITCALCHSITDGSVFKPAAGKHGGTIGKRVDGPTNHDLAVGKAIAVGKASRALYPTLALQLTANMGKSVSRKGEGQGLISAAGTEAEVDAYLNDPNLYPTGMFDDSPDGNGAPMHIAPFFRTDLAAPWGSEGSIHMAQNFANLVFTALFDPTGLTTEGGKKFEMERGGAAGTEIVTNYEAILADIGVPKGGQNGYPFVARTKRMVNGANTQTGTQIGLPAGAKMERSFIGVRVDQAKLLGLNAYTNSLRAPAGDKTDPTGIARGRNVFREQCTSCHRDDQSVFVPQNISPLNSSVELFSAAPKRPDLYPAWAGATVADRSAAGLAPVRNFPGTFDDKLIITEASNQGQPRGSALPLLMDLARKPTFLHDDSVKSLDMLLDPARTMDVPHPFFVADAAKRADVVKFLRSLDDQPLSK